MLIEEDKDLIVYEEEKEILLIHMKKNIFYALDAFSSLIWSKLIEYREVGKVIDYIVQVTNVEKDRATKDINEFILKLKEIGVIKIV